MGRSDRRRIQLAARAQLPHPLHRSGRINLSGDRPRPNTGATSGNKVGGNKVSLTQFNVFSDDLDMAVFWRAIGR
jgi:hypothetical protein